MRFAPRIEIFICVIVGLKLAQTGHVKQFWSAPAERSGDGALDSLGRQNQYLSKAPSPLRSADALHIRSALDHAMISA